MLKLILRSTGIIMKLLTRIFEGIFVLAVYLIIDIRRCVYENKINCGIDIGGYYNK